MANIGSFKKVGNEFQGEIVTLSVQTKGVRIVPETSRGNDNAPSHRVYVGRADYARAGLCGAAGLEVGFPPVLAGRAPHNLEGERARRPCERGAAWSVIATR